VPLRSAHASSVLQAVWHLALSMPRCEARRLMPRKRVTGYRTAILGNGTRAAKSNATITCCARRRRTVLELLNQLQQVLVTEYAPSAGIGWHRDRPEFKDVVGVSLRSPCLFRLRRKKDIRWERASIELQPRSAYLLRGPARTDWQHSIPPIDDLRYSVTFRSLRDSAK
jgi:alkylated DNA repair dioxygenase AlkB